MDVFWDRLDRDAWEAALPADACGMQHSWRYGEAAAAMGREVRRAEIWRGGRCLGLAQVLVRRCGPAVLGYLPRGPIALEADAGGTEGLAALRRGLPGPGARVLVTPATDRAGGVVPLLTPLMMAELPLLADKDGMRARLRGKWRNRLRRAERTRLKISVTTPGEAELSWLWSEDRALGRARGYRGLPRAFLGAWAAQKGAPMKLYTARARGDIVAAMLFLDHAPGVTYQLAWNSALGRVLSAHHALMWRAMCNFAKAGRAAIDLGPLDTVNAAGLARFKLGAGAVARDAGAIGLVLPRPRLSGWRIPALPGKLRRNGGVAE